jgi:ATP-dependent Lhr-like helicase
MIAQWFASRFGEPTRVQAACWPAIASGEHVLATAPTGSGKTLAAFLWFLDGMASGRLPVEGLPLLYVSPLKALNTDVRQNLLIPLREIKEYFHQNGRAFPEIRVAVRSGDSTPVERRLMLKRPPSILITTPESLAILVNSRQGQEALSGVKALILDEIHAVAGTKRGTFLMCAVERLTDRAGEFQRLALSATAKPLDEIARFVGGRRLVGEAGAGGGYVQRLPVIIDTHERRDMSLVVEAPGRATQGEPDEGEQGRGRSSGAFWDDIAARLRRIIESNRSTIVFVNSRRLAEQAAFNINRAAGAELAYVHHGSLSKDVRRAVETRMKAGSLKAIVATSSLELGIDIGDVDEVVLLGAPQRASQALQRLGRAGHGPGRTVRGRLIPLHNVDLLRCAILAEAAMLGDIEETRIPSAPLDVLIQVILGLCAHNPRSADELFDLVRRPYPYHDLSRAGFDSVLESLEGYRAGNRVRGIKRRLLKDPTDGRYSAGPGAVALLATAGGTIPDRGYFTLKLAGSEAVIGELDEEFVWERRQGEGFSLGNQRWRIVSIGPKDVHVVPWKGDVNMLPFWKAERQWRSPELSDRALRFLDEASALVDGDLEAYLSKRFPLEQAALGILAGLIRSQARSTGLTGRAAIAIEGWRDPLKPAGGLEAVIHTLRGNGVNYPLMLMLREAFRERAGFEPDAFSDNDCIVLNLPPEAEGGIDLVAGMLAGLGDSTRLLERLKPVLQSSGVFGAAFRENAIRALMVARSTFDKRVPLWLMRARAKALLEEVSRLPDFPIVTETWRECLSDLFDLQGLGALLDGVNEGGIVLRTAETRIPSPFARGVLWQETNEVLYRGDASGRKLGPSLSESAIKEAAASGGSEGGPELRAETLEAFERRARRLMPGWAPRGPREAAAHLEDRLAIGRAELEALFCPAGNDGLVEHEGAKAETSEGERARPFLDFSDEGASLSFPDEGDRLELHRVGPGKDGLGSYALPTQAARIRAALGSARPEGLEPLVAEWARFAGPFEAGEAAAALGAAPEAVEQAISNLIRKGIIADWHGRPCDAVNLESLFRLQRRLLKPELRARPADDLPFFMAAFAGLDRPGAGAEALRSAIESLIGRPARVSDWESFILPARVKDYSPALMDGTIQGSQLFFFGLPRAAQGADDDEVPDAKSRRDGAFPGWTAPAFPWEYSILFPPWMRTGNEDQGPAKGRASLGLWPRRFWDLKDAWGGGVQECAEDLWNEFFANRAATDSFQALRAGLRSDFGREGVKEGSPGRPSRASAERWKSGAPVPGEWFDPRELAKSEAGEGRPDAMGESELCRERVRILLKRHGLLFRSLLERELPALRFGALFGAMRRMELSGELMSGLFFEGIQGPQFISPEGLRLFRSLSAADTGFYTLSAADPASAAGLGIEELSFPLPPRSFQNSLVYHGGRLVLIARKGCAEVQTRCATDEEALGAFAALAAWLNARSRADSPARIILLSIDGLPAEDSPLAGAARAAGFARGYRGLEYYPRA